MSNSEWGKRIALERGWCDVYAKERDERLARECAKALAHRREALDYPAQAQDKILERAAQGCRLKRVKVSLATTRF